MEEKKENKSMEAFVAAVGVCAMFFALMGIFLWLDMPHIIHFLPTSMAIFSGSIVFYAVKSGNEKWLYRWLMYCFFILTFTWFFADWLQNNIWAMILVYIGVLSIAVGIIFQVEKQGKTEKATEKLYDYIFTPIIVLAGIVFFTATIIGFQGDDRQNTAQIVAICCTLVILAFNLFNVAKHKKEKKQ